MQILMNISDLKVYRTLLAEKRERVGLVPTMGALHEGHLSLVRRAQSLTDRVIVSIFVNPTQFGPNEDFSKYPRVIENDLAMLEACGADAVFLPSSEEIYPAGYRTYVEVEELGKRLCGQSRPTHFRGVATVVLKLLNLTEPGMAFFGQKDAQQFILLKKMAQDLCLKVKIVVCPIVREQDGLAMSSRNRYLNPVERQAALVLIRSLEWAQKRIAAGETRPDVLLEGIRKQISGEPLARLDYAELVNTTDLSPVSALGKEETLLALAIYIGTTRLIDNCFIPPTALREVAK
jgi:pantoate--beta-alanine ligase